MTLRFLFHWIFIITEILPTQRTNWMRWDCYSARSILFSNSVNCNWVNTQPFPTNICWNKRKRSLSTALILFGVCYSFFFKKKKSSDFFTCWSINRNGRKMERRKQKKRKKRGLNSKAINSLRFHMMNSSGEKETCQITSSSQRGKFANARWPLLKEQNPNMSIG